MDTTNNNMKELETTEQYLKRKGFDADAFITNTKFGSVKLKDLIEGFELSPMEVKEPTIGRFKIWDGIDCELVSCKDHKAFVKYCQDNYIDSTEGVHPDIEMIELYQQVSEVNVVKVKETKSEQFDEMVKITYPLFASQLQPPVISAEALSVLQQIRRHGLIESEGYEELVSSLNNVINKLQK